MTELRAILLAPGPQIAGVTRVVADMLVVKRLSGGSLYYANPAWCEGRTWTAPPFVIGGFAITRRGQLRLSYNHKAEAMLRLIAWVESPDFAEAMEHRKFSDTPPFKSWPLTVVSGEYPGRRINGPDDLSQVWNMIYDSGWRKTG